MFDQFYTQMQATPANTVTLDLSANMMLNPSRLWEKLSVIDTIDDKELFELLKGYYEMILNEIFLNKEQKFIGLFTNPKFISCMTQVLYNVQLPDQQKIRLNKMAYDYLVLRDNKDEYIQSLLMNMSKIVNRDYIPKLCGVGLPESIAALLAMARFSSTKDISNVRRLNRILMQQPENTLTEQMIVDIYLVLFNHILPLFEGIMLDVCSPQMMTPPQAEIYGLISLAILDLMNELPTASIKQGILRFIEDKNIMYPDSHIRFNLEACSANDYPRFLAAIDQLKQEGVYSSIF